MKRFKILPFFVAAATITLLVLTQCEKNSSSPSASQGTNQNADLSVQSSSTGSGNPHFLEGPVFFDNGTTLTATGSIVGLGNNQGVTIEVSALAEISSKCTNPGGMVVPGQSRTETIKFYGTFTSDKNGRVNFTVTSTTPKPGICPNGNWTGEVTDVKFSYEKVTVNGVQIYP